MKKLTKTLSLVLVVAMVLSLCVIGVGASYKDFTDRGTITKDYTEAAEIMTDLGCVAGMTATTYGPTGTFTRAQAAVILSRMSLGATLDTLSPKTVTFTDVPADYWGYRYIEYAANAGYVSGTGDGNYSPEDTLTGYQWAAMLMKVLGITVSNASSDWEINTARAYYAAATSFSDVAISGANITREAAVQMAYDALFKSTTTNALVYTIDGHTFTTAAEAVAYKSATGSSAAIVAGTATNDSLATVVFGVTRATDGKSDVFGRPAHVYTAATAAEGTAYGWTNKTKTIANVPVLTYTTATTSAKVFADLGLTANVDADNVAFIVDGAVEGKGDNTTNDAIGINYTATTTAIGGTGVLTEVYKTSSTTYTIVEINTYLGTIGTVNAATAVAKRTVAVTGVNGTLANDTLALSDAVLYTKAYVVSQYLLQTLAAPTAVTGTISKTASASGSTAYTIGDTTYGKNVNYVGAAATYKLGATGAWYVDSYGNLIGTKTVSAVTEYYGYLLAYAAQQYVPADLLGNSAKSPMEVYKFVDSTGAVVTKNGAFTTDSTGMVTNFVQSGDATIAAPTVNALFGYNLDANGNISKVYACTPAGSAANKTLTQGTAEFDSKMMTDNTVVFYVSNKGAANQSVAAYVGYTKAPTKTTTVGYESVENTANTFDALALQVSDVAASTAAKYAYFASLDSTSETTLVNGVSTTVYTYTNVYLDGVKGTLKFSTTPTVAAGALYTYTTSTTTGMSTLSAAKTPVSQAITSIQSTYFVAGSVFYTDANTMYYQIDTTTNVVTPVTKLPAVSATGAYTITLYFAEAGSTSTDGVNVVYFSVA